MKKQQLTSQTMLARSCLLGSVLLITTCLEALPFNSLLASQQDHSLLRSLFDGSYGIFIPVALIVMAAAAISALCGYLYKTYHHYQLRKTLEETAAELKTASHDVQACTVDFHHNDIIVTTKINMGGKLETRVFRASSSDLDENVHVLVRQLQKFTDELRIKHTL